MIEFEMEVSYKIDACIMLVDFGLCLFFLILFVFSK